jgi:aspartyl-tRNA(Asn)/glutamyl-tRNA(Gln) amidotransferase subunit C
MAQLDKETIKYLTGLSRIDCSEDEQEKILKDLQSILKHFEQLEELDTEGVPPCNIVLEDMQNVLREDVIGSTIPRETFLNNAPSQVGGMIRVPPVIKQS